MSVNDINSLSHTKWNCKYHLVFAPKYRRLVFYKNKKIFIGKILWELCEWKGVNIVEAETCPDHIHMLVGIPPKFSVSSFMGYLKGKSSTMLYEQFGELGENRCTRSSNKRRDDEESGHGSYDAGDILRAVWGVVGGDWVGCAQKIGSNISLTILMSIL